MNKMIELFHEERIEALKEQFAVYNKLCDKAKELLFVYNREYEHNDGYIDVFYLNEYLPTLSPIEQILDIAFSLYDYHITNQLDGCFSEREIQKEIFIEGKKYFADFYFNYVLKNQVLCKLKKPLIVECDGFEYHSSKKQVNYDYERENTLKLKGYDIIRFTGTQIFNDPFGCVEKIKQYMQNLETED